VADARQKLLDLSEDRVRVAKPWKVVLPRQFDEPRSRNPLRHISARADGQRREIIRYFRGDVALPERIILLDGSGSISFDVLSWLAAQKVSLIRIDWKGDIVCVAGPSGYSANPLKVRWQLETCENPGQRNDFCRSIITRKVEATIITLEKSIPRSDKWERAMRSAYAALSRLEENPPETIIELRALEANCAASYFRSWVGMPIKWRGASRRPIPDNWHSIGVRSSPYHLAGNRNAAHPVNAILNYAYAALESEIRIKTISEGYDPTIGIMHEGSDGSSKFIFDLMEPERPRVDRAVLDFVRGQVFNPADFVIRSDGVVRLNPEMARMVVVKVSAQKIFDVDRPESTLGRNRSRGSCGDGLRKASES